MTEYPKIYGPFKRETEGPNRNKLIKGSWTKPEFEYLANLPWHFTEKIDGTNIRVHWDGHKTTYGGRTERAQIPVTLVNWLDEHLPEELFEQAFGSDSATLYGEGYGAGIQKGGVYRPNPAFILFDVRVGAWWLKRDDIVGVGQSLGLEVVPLVLTGTIPDAIELVAGGLESKWGSFSAEGVVGVTTVGLLDRAGDRLTVKVKTKDFALNVVVGDYIRGEG